MTQRPPPAPVPLPSRWPVAIRSAELLRGTLVRCGPGVRPVGWPETPRVRLAALDTWLDPGRIAILLTAAWVWGFARAPDSPLELATPQRKRPGALTPTGAVLHQHRYEAGSIQELGGFWVTTPARTLTDMLRLSEPFSGAHRIACRLILVSTPLSREQVHAALREQAAPFRRRARERLDGL